MKKKSNNKKNLHPVMANNPTPKLEGNLPNKEKGIETLYLKDDFRS